MIEMKLRNGVVFNPLDAAWTITPAGSEEIFEWTDVVLIGMLDPAYEVAHGTFGPPGRAGMPVRGVRFTDTSELAVEVPMPLLAAQEMGRLLSESKIEVVRGMPGFRLRPGMNGR